MSRLTDELGEAWLTARAIFIVAMLFIIGPLVAAHYVDRSTVQHYLHACP